MSTLAEIMAKQQSRAPSVDGPATVDYSAPDKKGPAAEATGQVGAHHDAHSGAMRPTIAPLGDEGKSAPQHELTINESGLPGLPRQPARPGISPELQAAYQFHSQGLPPIPIKRGVKQAAIDNWQNRVIPLDDFAQYWGGNTPCGLAIPLGGRAKGLIDMDLDWPEARVLADELDFIFGSLLAFGRKGAPRSHRLAFCKESLELDTCRTLAFAIPGAVAKRLGLTDEEHATNVLELRGNYGYTIFPPSTHISGERIEWDNAIGRSVPEIPYQELRAKAGLLAFLAFMAKFYPPVGTRNDFNLALGGALLRALMGGYGEDEATLIDHVDRMVTVTCAVGGDKGHGASWEKRAAVTLAKIKGGALVTGLPKLVEILGIPELDKLFRKWLGVDSDDRPVIDYDETDYVALLSRAQDAMLADETGIYQRGDCLVNIYRLDREQSEDVKRPKGALVIGEVGRSRIAAYLTNSARFKKFIPFPKPRFQYVPPTERFCRMFLEWRDGWKFRRLAGTVEIPTMRPDGTILDKEGYDADTALFVDFNGIKFPTIPDNPTRADAEAALAKILKVFRGFPFDGNADGTTKSVSRSVALAYVLTCFVRRYLPTAPFFSITSPAAGTGKTKIVFIVSVIATGKPIKLTVWSSKQEENDKLIASILLCGDAMGAFDNVGDGARVTGDTMCAVMTAPEFAPRILGGNRKPSLSTAVTWSFTGNNISYGNGLERRGLECHMDAQTENPEERQFDFDAVQEATDNRLELVAAALTILRAWHVATDKDDIIQVMSGKPFGNFEAWSALVRGALIWLGEPDPCDSRKSIKADDTITTTLRTLMVAWAQCEGLETGTWYSLGQINAQGNHHATLASALALACPNGITDIALGRYLNRYKNKIVGGYRIVHRHHPDTRASQYMLEDMAAAEQPLAKAGENEGVLI